MHIEAFVAAELAEPVSPRVTEMAEAIAALYPNAARAVLFYGSCLREQQLDGLMLDFYVIVASYDRAYPSRWLALANRWIPPNVFPFAYDGLAAKYAVLSEADFLKLNGPEASNVSVWARFSQPTRLVWMKDQGARDNVIKSVARAAPTMFDLSLPISSDPDPLCVWQAGYAETYKGEIRAERSGRGGSIIDSDPDRFARFGKLLGRDSPYSEAEARRKWSRLQRRGKLLTIVRLAKASMTFAGGIDYLAWKINRHAGTQITIKPWQRKWPILAAFTLLPKLFFRGAIK